MNEVKKITCTKCNKDFEPNVATASPDQPINNDQIIPVCNECWDSVTVNATRIPFYKRWYYFLHYWFQVITSQYIIKKEYYTTERTPGGHDINVLKETTYYNFRDKRFYGVLQHAQRTNFFFAFIIAKRLKKNNTEKDSEVFLERLYPSNDEYYLAG